MFHVIEKELNWRQEKGLLEGFETMKAFKPVVAVGAEHPLEDQLMMADYFRMDPSFESSCLVVGLLTCRWNRWSRGHTFKCGSMSRFKSAILLITSSILI